jgi:Na+-driven multidrug efflux pump
MWIVATSYGAYGLAMVAIDSFNGLGAALTATTLSTLAIVLFLPLAVIGRELLGLNGLFAAIAVTNVAAGWVAFAWLGKRLRRLAQAGDRN